MNSGRKREKMLNALLRFNYEGKTKSRTYAKFKILFYETRAARWLAEGHPRKGSRHTEETKKRMSVPKKKTDLMGRYERTDEIIAQFKKNRVGKAAGANNSMANPEFRAKVGQSKIGRRKYKSPEGTQAKYCHPGLEPQGWALV